MKRTAKYVAAQQALKLLGPGNKPARYTKLENDELYAALEGQGYYWNSESGEWKQDRDGTARARGSFSGSIFEDSDGIPTGVYRLRIMANPEEIAAVCAEVCKSLTVLEVSQPYPNRRGSGVRVYITGKRK
jgi:hypothetical protein